MLFTSPPDRFLNIREVAEMIGLSVGTIYDCKRGTNELLRIRLGGRVVFSLNNVQEWMQWQARKAEEDERQRRLWAEYNSKEAVRSRCQQAVMNALKTIVVQHGGRWYERRK
jgi:predicted DNA-binding transcriptional regulator AlpA